MILGPSATPFEGGAFLVEIELPVEYPFRPPRVRLATKIFHMSWDHVGIDCLDVTTPQGWSPALTIVHVMEIYRGLLEDPNPLHTMRPDVGDIFQNDRKKFDDEARAWTEKFAITRLPAYEIQRAKLWATKGPEALFECRCRVAQFRGLVRARIVFVSAAMRARERANAPGGAGYVVAAARFHSAQT